MRPEDVRRCLALLEATRALDPDDPAYLRIEQAAAHLRKTAKKRRRRKRVQQTIAHDRAVMQGRQAGALLRHRNCYVCHEPYREPHPEYPKLCRRCGDRSRAGRDTSLSLSGRRALVTGGRIKIGAAVVRTLVDAGAEVHLTTRYPYDAARRMSQWPDADRVRSQVVVHGLDFRKVNRVLEWLETLRSGPPFDILVNNAAQTVWRSPGVRAGWRAVEQQAQDCGFTVHPTPEPASAHALVPWAPHALEIRRSHSWTQTLAEVDPWEMIEVQVVNAIVPFLLCGRLFDNLCASPHPDRYIINVTAVEGQFDRAYKPVRHPHTNMAKAALNMLTRTSAADYVEHGIYMVAVDPGWMSDEGPPEQVAARIAAGFQLPLQAEDSAARIVHPIREGRAGRPLHGVLLKNFDVVPW